MRVTPALSCASTNRDHDGSRPGRSCGGSDAAAAVLTSDRRSPYARLSPNNFAERGIQTRADSHAKHAVTRRKRVNLVGQRERQ